MNVTVPVGVVAPAPLVSATVAVHVEGDPTFTDDGEHTTVVEVVLRVEVTVAVPLLVRWLASPPYEPVIVEVPAADGVNVTLHVPATSVHDAALNVPATPVLVNVTVPVGVVAPAPLVSATVAVHVDAWLIATVLGEHAIVVDVVRLLTVTAAVPLLVAWTALPL